MSIIKSFSVGNGDTFYIKHGSDNFTIIDCNLEDENKESITDEIINESKDKGIRRFISTHPDEDHIKGIDYLDEIININNFYCVKNNATKEDESSSFKKYKELRDSEDAFYIKKDCTRKWMNIGDEERGCSGINILWPDENNQSFKNALKDANDGKSPNNISPIIEYSLKDGVRALWMGDLETDFMAEIKDNINFNKVNILFAPHHGRKSGKVPEEILKKLNPDVVIIGEAKSKDLNYYSNYNNINQNSAGDITFECLTKEINIYVSKKYEANFLKNKNKKTYDGYIGTIEI